MLLSASQIRERLSSCITPFYPDKVSVGATGLPALSYGVGHAGYDLQLGPRAKVLRTDYSTPLNPRAINPKGMRDEHFVIIEAQNGSGEHFFSVKPRQLFLGVSLEYIEMPSNLMGIVLGKSTYARAGLVVNATPIEPGWKGYLTLELVNTTHLPLMVYANEGIAQVLFLECGETEGYKGKYQHQPAEPVVGRV